MDRATIKILGGGLEVGRAAVSIAYRGKTVLMDYGVSFSEDDKPQLPEHIRPSEIHVVAVTHAHLDHVGAAPYLYTTSSYPILVMNRLTKAVAEVLIKDFIKISGYYLPFDESDWFRAVESIHYVETGEEVDIGDIVITSMNSGHIPGSQTYIADLGSLKVAYTGDVNTIDTRLVRGFNTSSATADVLVIEGTYADVDHPERDVVEKDFIDSVREVISSGGNVLIPCFSLGRAQEILSLLYEKFSEGRVYYDGMIRIMNSILASYPEYINKYETLLRATKEFEEVKSASQRRKIVKNGGNVVVASAGMLKGGPSLYYLKKMYDDSRNAVFLVSYQAPQTPGRKLLENGVLDELGPIRARVEWFDFSSHAGFSGLLKIVESFKGLRTVVIIHTGEQAGTLSEALRDRYEVYVPRSGESIEIST
ncbi:MAG: MBL fold metallo-hydrolase [Sulfolobales archaeon]|nr:MBL fold metallo-hydrolase [Sulfolobales archaeon]MDW8082676.1 MBL fold metallo-hydrolase [Sulfolobales archaeon]